MPSMAIALLGRPVNAYDDGRKAYIEFSPGIVQGEMPPLFVIGADGKTEIVNYRDLSATFLSWTGCLRPPSFWLAAIATEGSHRQDRREAS